MKLIGMLDSPYVRRVAISLKRLGIPFEHDPVSVFSTFEAFKAINPVVKAPTLVTDEGVVLMDSTLILDYLERLVPPDQSLLPPALEHRTQALRIIGLALAACEKAVQIVYEKNTRPEDKRHGPWLDRIEYQLSAAFAELEREMNRHALHGGDSIGQDGISVAVAWGFAQLMVPEHVEGASYPTLSAFSAEAERLAIFASTPAV